MLSHVLLGVGAGSAAADAVAFADYLGVRTGAGVSALHAGPPGSDPDRHIGLVRDAVGDTGARIEAVSDASPARALAAAAAKGKADLIVIGSGGRGAPGKVATGSVGEQLLRCAPCPVAVAPRSFAKRRHRGIGLIGVGYSGTAESVLALDQAAELARQLHAALRVIAVYDGVRQSPKEVGYGRWERADVAAELDAAAARVGDDIECEIAIVEGAVAPALIGEANGLDLLVLGSRFYGDPGRTVPGAVAHAITSASPCPVIVVPREARDDDQLPQDEPGADVPTVSSNSNEGDMMFKKIAVALDGSENSERAIPLAVELAEHDDAELLFIHIDEHLVGKAGDLPVNPDEPEVIAKIRRRADELSAEGIKTGVETKTVRLGGPAHVIASIADDEGADLIIAGRRGHSPIAGLLLGSVAQRLLQVASQPVLAVPGER